MRLRAVLFDMDGVLYNSMSSHAKAWHRAMAEFGYDLPEEEVYMHEGRTGASTVNLVSMRQRGVEETEERIRYEKIQAERHKRQEEGRKQQEERKKQQAEEHKLSLKEKQKAAQAAKADKAAKAASGTTEAGRVGNRPYARGRAYKEDRY